MKSQGQVSYCVASICMLMSGMLAAVEINAETPKVREASPVRQAPLGDESGPSFDVERLSERRTAIQQRMQATSPMTEIPYQGATVPVKVALNKSHVLEFPKTVKRVSVGNPEIADILVVRSRQIYVVGKSIGSTNVVIWDGNDRVLGQLNVEVTHDLEVLKANLHDLLPNEPIQVRSSYGTIVLSGQVSSPARLDSALRLANSFQTAQGRKSDKDGPRVLNLMEVGGAQQVMLDVKVAEVARTLVKRLNVQFSAFDAGGDWKIGAVNGGATFPDAIFESLGGDARIPVFTDGTPIGPAVEEFAPGTPSIDNAGIFASHLSGNSLFNVVIDAARNQGLARILAEPNLTTLTGQKANFLAGGEFPIPVPSGDGDVTIEFKEFGVELDFVPIVLDSGTINLEVDVAVSDLVTQNSVTVGFGASGVSQQFFVPSLVKRGASSTVELGNGQTIAIAGMIDENVRENVDKFPGLGDLPVIGALFRSQEFVKDQTELVIFVTPRLAKPIQPDQMRLPTEAFVEPSNLEFYLLGRVSEHRDSTSDANQSASTAGIASAAGEGGTEGQFGHDLGQ